MPIPSIFIRDDDVYCRDARFSPVFAALRSFRVPVIYGVIPGRLQHGMVSLLKRAKQASPGLLDIVQHGYMHRNYSAGVTDKYEFGPSRTLEQQRRDIGKGRRIMEEAFARAFTPAFVPPFHGYDRNTVKAVQEEGFPLFSAGEPVKGRKAFLDCPATVALNDYDRSGTPLSATCAEMTRRALRACACRPLTGLVFHHRALRSRKELDELTRFFFSLSRMRTQGKVRIILFSDLLRAQWNIR